MIRDWKSQKLQNYLQKNVTAQPHNIYQSLLQFIGAMSKCKRLKEKLSKRLITQFYYNMGKSRMILVFLMNGAWSQLRLGLGVSEPKICNKYFIR